MIQRKTRSANRLARDMRSRQDELREIKGCTKVVGLYLLA